MEEKWLANEIRIRKLDFLVNKLRTSNWGTLIMAAAISFFYWGSVPTVFLILWLILSTLITVSRALFVYPKYDRTEITSENVDAWLNWFTFTLTATAMVWGLAIPFFFIPDDFELLLVLIFTFFVLMVSGTVTLASHFHGFLGFCLPITVPIIAVFILEGEQFYTNFGIAIAIFSVFNLLFYRSTNQDITELIQLQIEKEGLVGDLEIKNKIAEMNQAIAEQSVLEKNRFLASASHDLRQPLHASGLLISMLDKHVQGQEGASLLIDVKAANRALTQSFNSLMDISKLDAGVVEVELRHLPLADLIQPLIGEFSPQINSKKLKLTVDVGNAVVYSDLESLRRIIRNVLSNAIKYTNQGEIKIYAEEVQASKKWRLTLSDTGIGISKSELETVFSEYYQIDNSERDREKGFGLGLSIVKRLCDLLDIEYSLTSKINVGTQLRLMIPVGSADFITENQRNEAILPLLSDLQILVIDDDKSVRDSMAKLLRSWECRVLEAESEDEAISLIDNQPKPPNLILADYRLKEGKTGIEACEKIFDFIGVRIPAMIITGDTSPERLQDLQQSAYPVMHKPVAPAELRSFLHRMNME